MKKEYSVKKMKYSFADRLFYLVDWIMLIVAAVVIILPLMNVVSSSVSDAAAVGAGKVYLLPVGFNLKAYKILFHTQALMTGFLNTVFYALTGTCLNIFLTVICAYPLSRHDVHGKGWIMMFFTFTMIFSGGMIPNYLLMKNLHLLNTRWVMILPGAMSVYNMIVARTFFTTNIPRELNEAAAMDGASDLQMLTKVALPLSKPILAVLTLFYAQGHWNAYFDGFMYLTNPKLLNLQVVLRNMMSEIASMMGGEGAGDMVAAQEAALMQDVVKYAAIVFTSIPIIMVYPFVQKYFVKGVMIGAVKG